LSGRLRRLLWKHTCSWAFSRRHFYGCLSRFKLALSCLGSPKSCVLEPRSRLCLSPPRMPRDQSPAPWPVGLTEAHPGRQAQGSRRTLRACSNRSNSLQLQRARIRG
jgi:hypothetical protein